MVDEVRQVRAEFPALGIKRAAIPLVLGAILALLTMAALLHPSQGATPDDLPPAAAAP